MAGPVQTRMVGEDLDCRPDDEGHQEQIEEVLPVGPGWNALNAVGRRNVSWVLLNEGLHGWQLAESLGDDDADDQESKSDRRQPEQVEPFGPSDAQHRGGSPLIG